MTSAAQLVEGRVYFLFLYADEGMRFPDLTSWVYLGLGVHPDLPANQHVFQSVESYCSEGKWTTLPEEIRIRLGPDALRTCTTTDVDLYSDASGLQAQLAEFARESGEPDS